MKKTLVSLMLIVLLALPAAAATVKITQNRTPLRAEATVTSSVVAYYQKGDLLELIDAANEWYRVRDPRTNHEGFVLSKLAELLPGPPVLPGLKEGTSSKPAASTKVSAPVPAAVAGNPAATVATERKKRANGWTDIGYIAVNGAYQAGSSSFSDTFSFGQYLEKADVTAQYPKKDGPTFDVGGVFRVWRNLALGASVTAVSRSTTSTISGAIPHPFFYNTGRAVVGNADAKRQETAVHIKAGWVVPVGRRMLVTLAAGPSFFAVKQSLVQSVTFSESYPFDTATLKPASVADSSKSVLGFNAGADVGYFFSKSIGVGATLRFAGANASLPSHSASVSVKVGGLQAGVGLRVRLPKSVSKKTPTKAGPPARPIKN